ncbi:MULTISPECIES: hypothetical protein [Xanthomonas]|uniref:hypothetical protein n=1 Tax=Xanthomonas TaxID=338 RepID=UPI00128FE388|nr:MULTISPECIES: hypothetical protein [Xanthomonas]
MSEPNTKLSEIQNLPAAELADLLQGLTLDELTALRAIEVAQKDGGRKGALAHIDSAIKDASDKTALDQAAIGEVQPAAGNPAATTTGHAEASSFEAGNTLALDENGRVIGMAPRDMLPATETPDWQHEAYSGPLNIPQADWRRHNIKPVRAVREK